MNCPKHHSFCKIRISLNMLPLKIKTDIYNVFHYICQYNNSLFHKICRKPTKMSNYVAIQFLIFSGIMQFPFLPGVSYEYRLFMSRFCLTCIREYFLSSVLFFFSGPNPFHSTQRARPKQLSIKNNNQRLLLLQ